MIFSVDDPSQVIQHLFNQRWNINIGDKQEINCPGLDGWTIGITRIKEYEFLWIVRGIDSVEFAELLKQYADD